MAKIPSRANRTLAAIYICLGRKEEAKAAVLELLEKNPDYTISKDRENLQPRYTNPAELERWFDAMIQAGMPE